MSNRRFQTKPGRKKVRPARPAVDLSKFKAVMMVVAVVGFASLALFLLSGVVKQGFDQVIDRQIAGVEVSGELYRITQEDLSELLQPVVGQDFLKIDLSELKQALERLPWVANATLTRRWPDRLMVAIEEERPVARWGQDSFLNVSGKKVEIGSNEFLASLPLLQGPQDSQLTVAKKFVELNTVLGQSDLTLASLTLHADLTWESTLANGLVLALGRAELEEKVARFKTVYATSLKNRVDEIETIDLRYNNGVAVGWAQQTANNEYL